MMPAASVGPMGTSYAPHVVSHRRQAAPWAVIRPPLPQASIGSNIRDWVHHALHHDAPHPPAYAHDPKLLVGTWVKDKHSSDTMGPAMDLMALGGIMRTAVKLVKGLKIEQSETIWSMAVFSAITWFKVTERYALSGQPSTCKRRDLRKGSHSGKLLVDQPGPHGGLQLALTWAEPHGGDGTDEFVLAPKGTAAAQLQAGRVPGSPTAATPLGATSPQDAELHVYSTINSAGQRVQYRTVYNRKH